MSPARQISVEIDKLTRSIENAWTGESFTTAVLPLTSDDMKAIGKTYWLFDWKAEAKSKEKQVFKLVIKDNAHAIQGLISLQEREDHVFMHIIESHKLNKGEKKLYLGVAGNLIAFACKLSFEKGFEGYVSFESKTKLVQHYQESLGASLLFGNIMVINSNAAVRLIRQYFPKNS